MGNLTKIDSVQTFISLVLVSVAISLFLTSIIGDDCNPEAEQLWEQIESVCDLTKSEPKLNHIELPNGNLGFTITCEK